MRLGQPMRFSEQGTELGAMLKSFGKIDFFATMSLQKQVTIRAPMEKKYRDVQFMLVTLIGSLETPPAEGDFLLEYPNVDSITPLRGQLRVQ